MVGQCLTRLTDDATAIAYAINIDSTSGENRSDIKHFDSTSGGADQEEDDQYRFDLRRESERHQAFVPTQASKDETSVTYDTIVTDIRSKKIPKKVFLFDFLDHGRDRLLCRPWRCSKA